MGFLELHGIVKAYGGLRPFRLQRLEVVRGEVVVLKGLDAAQAAVLVDLLTGATLPDQGDVLVGGRNTRTIESQEAWVAFLQPFGLAGERVVLLPELTLVQNLAIPLTLSVDPIPASIRPVVAGLAAEAGLPADRLEAAAAGASPAERARVRLGRAIAHDPEVLLLEHPTAGLGEADARSFGADLRRVASRRGLTVVAASADRGFAGAAAARVLDWTPATGELSHAHGPLRRLFVR